jgi:acetyl esterase/lipase
MTVHRGVAYGAHPAQAADLHLPARAAPPVVCLLHGGFWRAPHGREQFEAVARDLAVRGYAAWNIGYRRVGDAGGGWPGTFEDVALAIDRVATFAEDGIDLDLRRVVVAGHSAGAQLALLAAARAGARVAPVGVASLAGVVDLAQAHAAGVGRGAVDAFLGGGPDAVPDRYAAASPLQRLPLGVAQLVAYGIHDDAVPAAMSRHYAKAARAAGDAVEHVPPAKAGHMDCLDPASGMHAALCDWLERIHD